MLKAFTKPDSLVAIGVAAFSILCMVYAVELPIGWEGSSGPGGGAFPFWLSAVMLACALAILAKSVLADVDLNETPFFDPGTRGDVFKVAIALLVCIGLIGWAGAYVAIPLFMVWYLKMQGGHSWTLTGLLTLGTTLFVFFFFEVTLKILLPKGFTEPLFLPLYAIFF